MEKSKNKGGGIRRINTKSNIFYLFVYSDIPNVAFMSCNKIVKTIQSYNQEQKLAYQSCRKHFSSFSFVLLSCFVVKGCKGGFG